MSLTFAIMCNSVSVVADLTLLTVKAIRIVEAIVTPSTRSVTRVRIITIDIAITLTGFTFTVKLKRIAVEHSITTIASLAGVSMTTVTLECSRRLVEYTVHGEVVAFDARTSARFASYTGQRCTVVAWQAALTVHTGRVRSARVAHALACTCVAKSVAHALVTVWRTVVAQSALVTPLARMIVKAVTITRLHIAQVVL